jgi:hypothetical protein
MQIQFMALRCAVLLSGLGASAYCNADDLAAAASAEPRWEITVGASGKHNGNGWKIALPESEIKYQWSERLELMAKNSWVILRPNDGATTTGLGTAKAGFKWLFLDDRSRDFSIALYPQFARSLSRAAVRRGVISADKEYTLATETKFKAASMDFEVKTGRNFIEHAADEWLVEVKVTRKCLAAVECNVTVERNFVPSELQRTLTKAGIEWALNDTFTLKAEVGREIGPRGPDRKDLTVNVGLQSVF